jgi:hypothetical protein
MHVNGLTAEPGLRGSLASIHRVNSGDRFRLLVRES